MRQLIQNYYSGKFNTFAFYNRLKSLNFTYIHKFFHLFNKILFHFNLSNSIAYIQTLNWWMLSQNIKSSFQSHPRFLLRSHRCGTTFLCNSPNLWSCSLSTQSRILPGIPAPLCREFFMWSHRSVASPLQQCNRKTHDRIRIFQMNTLHCAGLRFVSHHFQSQCLGNQSLYQQFSVINW